MAHLILHPGLHKTGTTAIQKLLESHSAMLQRSGIGYVKQSQFAPALRPLVNRLGRKLGDVDLTEVEQITDELVQEALQGKEAVILSYEDLIGSQYLHLHKSLYPHMDSRIAMLARLAEKFDRVSVVLTIRNQAELLESMLIQLVKQGIVFDPWSIADEIDLESLSLAAMVRRLNEAFGADRVTVLAAESCDGDPALNARALVALHDEKVAQRLRFGLARKRPNPSLSEAGLKLALATRPAIDSKLEWRQFRKFLEKNYAAGPKAKRARILKPEQRARILDRHWPETREMLAAAGLSALGPRYAE